MQRIITTLVFTCVLIPGLAAPVGPLASRPEVNRALALIKATEHETLAEQSRLCEIAAPPFEEGARASYYREKLVELGLEQVRIDAAGNVIGVRRGRVESPLVVLSAHLDTVFPAGTDTTVTRDGPILKAPGIADDARGLAVVLAVIRALNEANITTEGTVVFAGTVGEEGLGDLRGVRHLFEQELRGRITHFISIDGTGLGVKSEAVGSHRYRVTFRAAGGHSFGMFGLVNPIHALGRAVEKIARIEVPEKPKTTFNVGRIEGGTSVNSIARAAWFEIDLRSVDADALGKLDEAFHARMAEAVIEENTFWEAHAKNPLARMTNTRTPVSTEIEAIGRRPGGRVPADAPILNAVRRANAALSIETKLESGSTDANIPISMGVPAVTLSGGGRSTGAHSLQEQFDTTDSHLGTQRAFLALLEIVSIASEERAVPTR